MQHSLMRPSGRGGTAGLCGHRRRCRRGSWKNLSFKKYNLEAKGVPPVCGQLHPLLKVREEFRKIFFEMGCGACGAVRARARDVGASAR